jgi:hypothetical protein
VIDQDVLHGFLEAGNHLLQIKNDTDKIEIKNLMETLEAKWQVLESNHGDYFFQNFENMEHFLDDCVACPGAFTQAQF